MDIVYCVNCGSEALGNQNFCKNCGKSIKSQPIKNTEFQQYYPPLNQSMKFSHYPIFEGSIPRRRYWPYIVVTIISTIVIIFGILYLTFNINGNMSDEEVSALIDGFIAIILVGLAFSGIGTLLVTLYTYHNFNDFRNMIRKYHPNTYPQPQDPMIMVLIRFVFSPIMVYFKYNQLFLHLQQVHNRQTDLPISAKKILVIILSPVIFIPIFIILALLLENLYIFIFIPTISIVSTILFFFFENQWQIKFNHHLQFHETMGDEFIKSEGTSILATGK